MNNNIKLILILNLILIFVPEGYIITLQVIVTVGYVMFVN